MPGRSPRFDEKELRRAIAVSFNWKETLRRLDYCPTGNNSRTIKKYVGIWGIDVSHFNPDLARHRGITALPAPLSEVLVTGSTYSRGTLKQRLYAEGLKERRCEMCDQGEEWLGGKMALILDHVNGVRDDNRLENLWIVCPNCAATLPTHCGRGLRKPKVEVVCEGCGKTFLQKFKRQRFCSRECGQAAGRIGGALGVPRPRTRKVERPPRKQLLREIAETNYCAVGRKYGVTNQAIRKWVRAYEREAARGNEND